MADHLKNPNGASSTSAMQPLSKSPEDMPNWGAGQGQMQSTSEMVKMSRTPNPVAAFGAHPSQGSIQGTGTSAPLSRKADSPYGHISKTKPQVDL